MAASATAIGSTVGDSSPLDKMLPKDKAEGKLESLGLQIQQNPWDDGLESPDLNLPLVEAEFHLEDCEKVCPCVEHQFIPSFTEAPPLHENVDEKRMGPENLSALKHGSDEDDDSAAISLQLGDHESKRTRLDPCSSTGETK